MFVKSQIAMSLNCTKMHFWSKFLVILAWTGDKLSYQQAQNGIKFDF